MMTNESTLMLHSALSGSSTNQLDLDSTDPKDLFSYKTALGANSSGITIVGGKRKFSASLAHEEEVPIASSTTK